MTADRNRKLAEAAELVRGVLHGIAAFDDRLDEMGPGVPQRCNGRGGKGSRSDPTAAEMMKPARAVASNLDRLVDRLHAVALDVDQAYGEIARPRRGLPPEGEPSCAWCLEAVHAAAKVEKREGKSPIPLDFRSPTYLYAEERKGAKVTKALVCEWCYRFSLRHERKPTIEERWIHAQGGQVHPKPANSVKLKAATRAKANA